MAENEAVIQRIRDTRQLIYNIGMDKRVTTEERTEFVIFLRLLEKIERRLKEDQ